MKNTKTAFLLILLITATTNTFESSQSEASGNFITANM